MPGVIMADGSRNGGRTNHDREPIVNGANGALLTLEKASDKGKGRGEPGAYQKQSQMPNGANGSLPAPAAPDQDSSEPIPADVADRIQQLPLEIVHITEGFVPLSQLLSRLAQSTHNRLSAKITELAAMPTPSLAVNGNAGHFFNGSDDNSGDNARKKVSLLKFAEETHANWTKALVIAQWSRVSEDVSKIIDLKVHLDGQRLLYDAALFDLSEVKRSLVHARVPNPDLRTAVGVLSTGKATWMPDLGYIEPPPLTAKDLLKSLQDLDTLLSIRLNLHEYDKIPPQFRDFSIKSGRATFRVSGEFEVDLTIADEDPEKQFWFIDFRFLFAPAVSELPEQLRYLIEDRVNVALEKDGLAGCYNFLHELVLTHKINEIKRQAIELSRGKWIEMLNVEPLHRALSIQYWVDRYGKDGPQSWIILGVDSGKPKNGSPDSKATSHISMRWFRDSKEVKDHEIKLELATLSTESLLQMVISRHIFYILGSTYKSLVAKPLFSSKQLSISFKMSEGELQEPELKVQLSRRNHITITIGPVTGCFVVSPASRLAIQAQWKINNQTKDPATNAHDFIDNLRCVAVSEEVVSRALSVGWVPTKNPGFKQEDLKPIFPRDTLQLSWFRPQGWSPEWAVALSSSMSGERWWLIEITSSPTGPKVSLKVSSHLQIPLGTTMPNHTYTLLASLHLYAAAMVSYYTNSRALHNARALYIMRKWPTKVMSSAMKLPAIFVKLSDILPSKNRAPRTGKAWAKDVLKISFQGLEYPRKTVGPKSILPAIEAEPQITSAPESQEAGTVTDIKIPEEEDENAVVIAEACLCKPMPPSLDLVKQRVDKDIAFHPTSGSFAFRFHTQVGEATIAPLTERLQRVEQLVDFVDVVKRHEKTLHCETVSLGRIIFSYGDIEANTNPDAMAVDTPRIAHRAEVDFSGTKTPMTLILEHGNPQIRILDHLTKTLNSNLGLDGVATLLPLTLPLMTALRTIEESWEPLTDYSDVVIFDRAVDWHIIRYNNIRVSPKLLHQRVMIEVRLQHRRGEAWWMVRRLHGERSNNKPDVDEIDTIDTELQAVWNDRPDGEDWRGMSTSGIARVNGVPELLRRVDDVIRNVAAQEVPESEAELNETQQSRSTSLQQDTASNPHIMRRSDLQPRQPQQRSFGRNKEEHEMIVID